MKHYFLDTNALLDLLLEREPHATFITILLMAAKRGEIRVSVSSLSIATAYYVGRKEIGRLSALRKLDDLVQRMDMIAVNDQSVRQALTSPFKDFENALQYHTATQRAASYIITRNPKDFKHAVIPIGSPREAALSLL